MKRFINDLEKAIDSAQERGVSLKDIDAVASRRLAEYATAKYDKQSQIGLRIFIVVASVVCSAGIYGVKTWLTVQGYKIPDDNFLNVLSGILILAAGCHYYDVPKVIRLLRGKDK